MLEFWVPLKQMFTRFAVLVAVVAVAFVGFASPSVAGPAPEGSDPSVSVVNRHLATLLAPPPRQRPSAGVVQAGAPGLMTRPTNNASALFSPAILSIVSHFTKAEHLLHFQSHGLDANLWGALNGGPGVKIRYSFKF